MTLKKYQRQARETAIYLNTEHSELLYPALGLIGECGEVANQCKKLIRDDGWRLEDCRAAAIAKELGDCCWYLANICCAMNIDIGEIYAMRGAYITHQVQKLSLSQLVLRMNRRASNVATILEKCYYSHDNKCTPPLNHLANIIVCIEEIGKLCGNTLEEICIANLTKLAKRKLNDTIMGDGDDR